MNLKEIHIKGYILLASVMLMLCTSIIAVAAFRNIASEELRINYNIAKTKAAAFCKKIKLKKAQVFSNPPALIKPT